jgi:hypothetical protein
MNALCFPLGWAEESVAVGPKHAGNGMSNIVSLHSMPHATFG